MDELMKKVITLANSVFSFDMTSLTEKEQYRLHSNQEQVRQLFTEAQEKGVIPKGAINKVRTFVARTDTVEDIYYALNQKYITSEEINIGLDCLLIIIKIFSENPMDIDTLEKYLEERKKTTEQLSNISGTPSSRAVTPDECDTWFLNKAKLDKLLAELKEQGIDYKDLMLREDRDSLTPEEIVYGTQFMELMMKVGFPVIEDRLKKESEVFSDILGIPVDAIEEGVVVAIPPSPHNEDELKAVLREFNIPESILYKVITSKECARIIDQLTERKPYTEAQKWLILTFTDLMNEFQY